MLTYQEGNTLYIEHRFLLDLIDEIQRNPDKHPLELEQRLNCVSINVPQCGKVNSELFFNCISWFDKKRIRFSFVGDETTCSHSHIAIESNGYDFSLKFSARLSILISISAIESFDSTATNGYFPVKIDF